MSNPGRPWSILAPYVDDVTQAYNDGTQSFRNYLNQPGMSALLQSTLEAGRRTQDLGDKTALASATAAIMGAPTLNPVWEGLAATGVGVGATTSIIGQGMQGAASYLQSWRNNSPAPMIRMLPNAWPGIDNDY